MVLIPPGHTHIFHANLKYFNQNRQCSIVTISLHFMFACNGIKMEITH